MKCPHCGSENIGRYSNGKKFDENGFPINTDIYKCNDCGKDIGYYGSDQFVCFPVKLQDYNKVTNRLNEQCKTILGYWKKAYKKGNSVRTILVETLDEQFCDDDDFPDESLAGQLNEKDLCDLVIKFCQWAKKQ